MGTTTDKQQSYSPKPTGYVMKGLVEAADEELDKLRQAMIEANRAAGRNPDELSPIIHGLSADIFEIYIAMRSTIDSMLEIAKRKKPTS